MLLFIISWKIAFDVGNDFDHPFSEILRFFLIIIQGMSILIKIK